MGIEQEDLGLSVRYPETGREPSLYKVLKQEPDSKERHYKTLYEWEKKTREVLQAIREPLDTEKVFPVAIEQMARALNVDRAFIVEFDGDTTVRPIRYEYRSHDEVKPFTGIIPPWAFCPYLAISARNEMAWSADTYNDDSVPDNEQWHRFSRHYDIRSIVASPILYKGKLMNVLVFHMLEPRQWTRQELFFIKVVGDQLSTLFYQEKAREELIQAAQLKSDFLSRMSHELRTPLNAMIGYTQMVEMGKAGPLNEKQAGYLKKAVSSGKHLLVLINDLLDFSKLEAGKMHISPEPIDAAALADEVNVMMSGLAREKEVSLFFQVQPGATVEADPGRLKQILINLISNGIKFNRKGGSVMVSLECDGPSWFIGRIRDTGIGISAEKLPELFNQFHQIDRSPGRQHEGSGLGLVLARELVELHGGKMTVESEEGCGSTFTFRLPLQCQPITAAEQQ